MLVKPIYEFVLWDNCKNSCSFCWQKKHNYNQLQLAQKELALSRALNILNQIKDTSFHILLIGGELFDSIEHKDAFLNFINSIVCKMKTETIEFLYINTNLLNSNDDFLDEFINVFIKNNLISRLKFTTSYDAAGRFSNNNALDEWRNRLLRIKRKFFGLNIVVNSILTKQLCNCIINKKIDIVKQIKDEFGCYVSLLPYIPVCKVFMPERTEVFTTLRKVEYNNPGYIKKYIQLLDLKQPRIVLKFNGKVYEEKSAKNSECGHSENLKLYSSGNTCFVCDLKTVFGNYFL